MLNELTLSTKALNIISKLLIFYLILLKALCNIQVCFNVFVARYRLSWHFYIFVFSLGATEQEQYH